MARDSSLAAVDVLTRLRAGQPRNHGSIAGGGTRSRKALEHTQSPNEWVREVGHFPKSRATCLPDGEKHGSAYDLVTYLHTYFHDGGSETEKGRI